MVFTAFFTAGSAHADLYRWIDPDSGSVKFSSLPPTDARVKAELVTSRSAPLPRASAPSASQAVAPLDTRWRELVTRLMAVTANDVLASPDAVRQQIEMLQAMRAELDRSDPPGAPERQKEQLAVLERLRQAMGAAGRTDR